jgi:hypothetical protein
VFEKFEIGNESFVIGGKLINIKNNRLTPMAPVETCEYFREIKSDYELARHLSGPRQTMEYFKTFVNIVKQASVKSISSKSPLETTPDENDRMQLLISMIQQRSKFKSLAFKLNKETIVIHPDNINIMNAKYHQFPVPQRIRPYDLVRKYPFASLYEALTDCITKLNSEHAWEQKTIQKSIEDLKNFKLGD